jgi:hypothetical protein
VTLFDRVERPSKFEPGDPSEDRERAQAHDPPAVLARADEVIP